MQDCRPIIQKSPRIIWEIVCYINNDNKQNSQSKQVNIVQTTTMISILQLKNVFMVRGLVSWAPAMQAVPNTKLINMWNHFKATKGIWVRYVYGVVPVSQYLHTEGVGQWVCSRIGCICLLFHLLKKVGHAANTNMYGSYNTHITA